MTLSAAVLKWTDTLTIIAKQLRKNLSVEELRDLSWDDRSTYLRENHVTAARHFNNRVQLFFKYILMNKIINPLGEGSDYKYRIEFQSRGSPHVPMLIRIKDATTFEDNSEEKIEEFIDGKVTCSLADSNERLSDLVNSFKNTHTQLLAENMARFED